MEKHGSVKWKWDIFIERNGMETTQELRKGLIYL